MTQDAVKVRPVRFSHLRAYGQSGMHGRDAQLRDKDATTAMQRGTAVHAIIFKNRNVCGYPGSQRRGKDFDAFVAEHPDTEILTMAEYDKARRMADAVLASKTAQPWIQGVTEETLLFRWMGLECRATPDIRGPNFITELKTSNTAHPDRFVWQARRMGYPAQMVMQRIACDENGHDKVNACMIVCVEDKEPYPVTVFQIQDNALIAAEKSLILWAERLKVCEQSGEYPPYSNAICPIDIEEEEPMLTFPQDDDMVQA